MVDPANYDLLTQLERARLRLVYVRDQGGKCYHCGADLVGPPTESIRRKSINWRLFPKNFCKWPIHLHHSRKTGLTIGAVHALCNAVLWQYHGE